MPDVKTLDIPLEGGLNQKTDVLWLEPGSVAAATNLVHAKHGSIQKRQGLQALTASWTSVVGPTAANIATGTMSSGRRLGSIRGDLVMTGNPGGAQQKTDAVFTFQDSYGAKEWVMNDLAPEVYAYPYEIIAQGVYPLYEMDVAIANGLEMVVYRDTKSNMVYATCRDAALGTAIVPPTRLSTTGNFKSIGKVIVCGKYFVVAWSSSASGDKNIYAATLDSTAPGSGFSSATAINVTAGDSINQSVSTNPNPYDICTAIGDTGNFAIIYEATAGGGARSIVVNIVAAATLSSVRTATVNGSDSQWTTDDGVSAANSAITALAIRADNGLNELAFTYTWKTTTTNRVSAGLYNYGALTVKRSTINLLAGGSVGMINVTGDNTSQLITIELVKNASSKSTYVSRWSPGSAVMGPAAAQLPYVAGWQWSDTGAALSAATAPTLTPGVTLWSRDLVINGIAYCMCFLPCATQGTFYLMADDSWTDSNSGRGSSPSDYFPMRLVGIVAPRLSSAMVTFPPAGQPVNVSHVATHIVQNPYAPGGSTYETLFPIELNVNNLAVAAIKFDFASMLIGQTVELGQNIMIASACGSGFDGNACYELGYPYYPVIVSVTMAGSGGALSAGTYLYIVVWYWIDARGQAHESARSAPVSATAVSNDSATIKIASLGFTGRTKSLSAYGHGSQQAPFPVRGTPAGTNVGIKIYRTQVNGTNYTNILSSDNIAGHVDQSVTAQSFGDTASDASILANTALYGDGSDGTQPGNLLDNLCGPAFQGFWVHNNRLFGIDGPRIWPSKEFTTGEGSAFHEAMAFSVDDGPGPVVALASMDDKLVIFKSDRLFFVTGLGPADNGQDNDFSQPQRIASDVGAIDWRGVVSTPQGVFFQSPAGRRLLTRDLQVVPVPAVEDIDLANPLVTSAVIHPTSGRVLFTENTDDVTAPRVGTVLHNDYVVGAWTQANYNDGAGHSTLGFVSACVAQAVTVAGPPVTLAPTYHVLRADGTVLRESGSSSFDTASSGGGNLFVGATWTSPWLKADGLQGWGYWQAVRIAFQRLDAAKIKVQLAYDGSSTPTDTMTFTDAQIQTMGSLAIIALQPTNERAATMQITISDASDGSPTTGAGFRLQGVRVDYGFEPGGYRAPITQQA